MLELANLMETARRRDEKTVGPSLKPSPRVKLAEPPVDDEIKKPRRMPAQLNRRPPPPSHEAAERK